LSSDQKELIIVGAGGHARAVIDAAELQGFNILGIVDTNYHEQDETIINYEVIGGFSELEHFDRKATNVFIAIGDAKERNVYFEEVKKMGFSIPKIIHPTAILSKYVTIGDGVFVNAGVILNAKVVIGANSVVNTGAILDHEVHLGRHSHVASGCKIGGRVRIGDFTFIGIGATVIDKIKIGSHVMVGAGSVVINDVESNSTVVGIPARRSK